jgi:hypothetical protein
LRHGSSAARWPALRQGITATHLDVANPTQEGDQGGEESRAAGWVAHGGAAMESWPARWRGVRRRGRCSRRWSSSSASAPRPQLVHVLLPPARRGVVLGVSTASRRCRCPCSGPAPGSSLARRDAVAARLLLLPNRRKQGRWRMENPKGVGGLASVPRLPGALLNRGSKQPGVDCPQCPWPFAGKGRWIPWRPLVPASDARGAGQ